MKIIINCSNILIGGAIQVSLSVIHELSDFAENEYAVFLSEEVENQIEKSQFPENFTFYSFREPLSNIFKNKQAIKRLNRLEAEINPDVIFTVFGPSYWKPKGLHISGFADGWCYTPNNLAYRILSFKDKVALNLRIWYKNFFLKKTSKYLIVETQIAKDNIVKHLNFSEEQVFVVGNTYSDVFTKKIHQDTRQNDGNFHFLTLSSYYIHKNLQIINDVCEILKQQEILNVRFYTTIHDNDYRKYFSKNEFVINLGLQKLEDCPSLYQMSDAMFLPTLLETFSASYPEAMKMETPILTSDLDFAHYVCDDAALYFDPQNAEDIADKIAEFISNKTLREQLTQAGLKRLEALETPRSRTRHYLDIFETMVALELHNSAI